MSEQEKLEKKCAMLRQEVQQYLKDLRMWATAHASDYPVRRISEIHEKLEEIEKI